MNTIALRENWKKIAENDAFMSIMGFILLVLSSQIIIPMEPVPITLQTMGALFIGLTFTPRAALGSITVFAIASVMGAPIYAGWTAKLAFGTTGGYIVGFLTSSVLISLMMQKLNRDSWIHLFFATMVGTIVTFIFGLSWLSYLIGVKAAIISGLLPFIIPGIVKAALLVAMLKTIRRI